MENKQRAAKQDETVIEERHVLKLKNFVNKVGGIEQAKAALDSLNRLRKPA